MKQLVVGILAHVDAGKTTLSEGILYLSGCLKKLGRVDHQTAFLDTHALERERGITIFSKQAIVPWKQVQFTLLDTPGHADFSTEMERTLQVLDYAILVISGTDGIQGHTETLWRLLKLYHIPTFLFINKMDLCQNSQTTLMQELKQRLSASCVDFTTASDDIDWLEQIALCEETLLEQYLQCGTLETEDIAAAIDAQQIFPCYFGSALKLEGISALLDGLQTYTRAPAYPADFKARVYKIARDQQGNRLTYLKITGGSLKVKTVLSDQVRQSAAADSQWSEKVDQIRIYSGAKYQTTDEAKAGTVCAVTGLTKTYAGQALGAERMPDLPILVPVLTYQVLPQASYPIHELLRNLKQLEEEDPQLHIVWNAQLNEIHIQLMGEIQLEILRRILMDRFGMEVSFSEGSIVYKETICAPVAGAGHFEPLRHFAEVHLLLEPGEPGSGLVFDTVCREDQLDRNWQRLILSHLEEKEHPGVLIGAPITDMKITLVAGKAHLKHTEGGDFRQATYRAVRQGLKKASSVLLEPCYQFRLELPFESVGRAMSDLEQMHGSWQPPEMLDTYAVITGTAPVATMRGYLKEVNTYTHGHGRLFCTLKGYEPCHNTDEVVAAIGYDSDKDVDNPADSVFCAHGASSIVPWYLADAQMHLPSPLSEKQPAQAPRPALKNTPASPISYTGSAAQEKELEAIFTRTYGPVKRRGLFAAKPVSASTVQPAAQEQMHTSPTEPRQEYLLVDGYNIIFAWDALKTLALQDMQAARQALIHTLCNYQGYKKCGLILVFDAYKVRGGQGAIEKHNGIFVVYTKEAETADMYIEKVTYQIGQTHRIRVATSDALEQIIILGHGATRISASAFEAEVRQVTGEISNFIANYNRTHQ